MDSHKIVDVSRLLFLGRLYNESNLWQAFCPHLLTFFLVSKGLFCSPAVRTAAELDLIKATADLVREPGCA